MQEQFAEKSGEKCGLGVRHEIANGRRKKFVIAGSAAYSQSVRWVDTSGIGRGGMVMVGVPR
jgi:hypothetical protein